jgi:membrane-bound ClpP family serine protease
MRLSVFTKISLIYLVRSIARMVSFACLIFIAMVVVGQGMPDVHAFTRGEIVSGIMFVIMLAGLVVGWWRELAGALLIIGGFAGFMVSEYATSGDVGMSGIFMLIPFSGALFFTYWLLVRRL